jgi:uncharacterized protein YdaU (DUF1376 family)
LSEFYKMEPLRWDRGTDDLTLEQEAAYLRVCNAIYAADQPIRENYRLLAGMWRCNERKAKRLLAEVIATGKLRVEGGWIINEKAVEDVSKRRELRVKRQLAGHSGGIESGKSRAKPRGNKETTEASASTRKEVEIEVEAEKKKVEPRKRGHRLPSDWKLGDEALAYAISKGLTDAQAEREAEKFAAYWHGESGQRASKMDWHQAWQTWVLRDAPAKTAAPSGRLIPNFEQAVDNLERGIRAGRWPRADLLMAAHVEALIQRKALTREEAARRGFPLAAEPLRSAS